jgi:hypothetical protein
MAALFFCNGLCKTFFCFCSARSSPQLRRVTHTNVGSRLMGDKSPLTGDKSDSPPLAVCRFMNRVHCDLRPMLEAESFIIYCLDVSRERKI